MEVSGEDLLRDVVTRYDDDGARLVYADWLTQRGDPRGELIVVQCALASQKGATIALVEREKALLDAHRSEWVKEAMAIGRECEIRRGFVATLVASGKRFASMHGARLMEHEPLEELVLCDEPDGAALDALAAAPHVGRLRTLRITARYFAHRQAFGTSIGARGLIVSHIGMVRSLLAFVTSPHVRRLRELELQLTVRGGVRAADLLTVQWPKLKLKLDIAGMTADEERALQKAMRWATISAWS